MHLFFFYFICRDEYRYYAHFSRWKFAIYGCNQCCRFDYPLTNVLAHGTMYNIIFPSAYVNPFRERSDSVVECLRPRVRVSPASLRCVLEQDTLILAYYWLNPGHKWKIESNLKPNGISHFYQLDQSISVLRVLMVVIVFI